MQKSLAYIFMFEAKATTLGPTWCGLYKQVLYRNPEWIELYWHKSYTSSLSWTAMIRGIRLGYLQNTSTVAS